MPSKSASIRSGRPGAGSRHKSQAHRLNSGLRKHVIYLGHIVQPLSLNDYRRSRVSVGCNLNFASGLSDTMEIFTHPSSAQYVNHFAK